MENIFIDEHGVTLELLDSVLSKLLIIGPPDEETLYEEDFLDD